MFWWGVGISGLSECLEWQDKLVLGMAGFGGAGNGRVS